jgi:hypothetical protein
MFHAASADWPIKDDEEIRYTKETKVLDFQRGRQLHETIDL